MANELRRQIREAAETALTGLATTGARVFPSRVKVLQDADLPGLRLFTNDQQVTASDITANPVEENELELVVEGCAKASADLDDTLDAIIKEVRVALAGSQSMGGAKRVQLASIAVEMSEAEKDVGVARMTFNVLYHSKRNAPDVAV